MATPLARADVETGVKDEITRDFADKGASGGCPSTSCWAILLIQKLAGPTSREYLLPTPRRRNLVDAGERLPVVLPKGIRVQKKQELGPV